MNAENGFKFLKIPRAVSSISDDPTRSMVSTFSQMATSSTRSGHQVLILFRFSANSTHGIGMNLGQERMTLDASTSRSRLSMENQEFLTKPSTRSILKDQMEKRETETRRGLAWQFRTQRLFCMIASGGILRKSSSGLTRDPLLSQSKA